MKKLDFQRLMDDSRFMKVLSVGVAILFWFVVAFTISPTITTTVSDVPITISGSNETLSSVGLDVVDGQNRTVRVKVEGRREVVGSLKPSDIVVYPVLTSVTEAGKYTCSLRAVKADSAADFTILSVSPEQVELTFDRVKTLKTELSVAVSGYTAEEGYILGSSAANPKEITVKGPESAVDQVAKAEVRLDGKDTKLAKTAKVEAEDVYKRQARAGWTVLVGGLLFLGGGGRKTPRDGSAAAFGAALRAGAFSLVCPRGPFRPPARAQKGARRPPKKGGRRAPKGIGCFTGP